jgi:hypothetical protein
MRSSLKKEAVDAIDEDSRKDVEEIKLYLDSTHRGPPVLSTLSNGLSQKTKLSNTLVKRAHENVQRHNFVTVGDGSVNT